MPELMIKAIGPRAAGKTVALRKICDYLTSEGYDLIEDNTDTCEFDEHFIRLRWDAETLKGAWSKNPETLTVEMRETGEIFEVDAETVEKALRFLREALETWRLSNE